MNRGRAGITDMHITKALYGGLIPKANLRHQTRSGKLAKVWIGAWIICKVLVKKIVSGYGASMDDSLPIDLGKRVGDLDELPEELRSQLQIGKVGEFERQVISLIADRYDGVANVDEILVGLYRETGAVHARQFLANKLYRMGQAGQIISVPKKKGVYRTK